MRKTLLVSSDRSIFTPQLGHCTLSLLSNIIRRLAQHSLSDVLGDSHLGALGSLAYERHFLTVYCQRHPHVPSHLAVFST